MSTIRPAATSPSNTTGRRPRRTARWRRVLALAAGAAIASSVLAVLPAPIGMIIAALLLLAGGGGLLVAGRRRRVDGDVG